MLQFKAKSTELAAATAATENRNDATTSDKRQARRRKKTEKREEHQFCLLKKILELPLLFVMWLPSVFMWLRAGGHRLIIVCVYGANLLRSYQPAICDKLGLCSILQRLEPFVGITTIPCNIGPLFEWPRTLSEWAIPACKSRPSQSLCRNIFGISCSCWCCAIPPQQISLYFIFPSSFFSPNAHMLALHRIAWAARSRSGPVCQSSHYKVYFLLVQTCAIMLQIHWPQVAAKGLKRDGQQLIKCTGCSEEKRECRQSRIFEKYCTLNW